ncbi:MAG: IS3 family transposase [Anaerobutyricum sp.]
MSEKTEAAKKAGRRVSVSRMLKFLGVSRSGYLAWLHHVPSDTEKRRKAVKAKIQDIYDDSKQNYGAPKITVELRKTGEVISERTVGTYMRQMGIRAQWSKPWTITTKIPISALNYKISSMSSLILIVRMQSGVRILPTSGQ